MDDKAIAIIGLSCRLPGASSPAQFWENLRRGVESVRFLTRDEAIARGLEGSLADDPRHVKAVAAPDDLERFDAAFFGIGHREAEITDPQQRILLECAWEALEDAGCDPAAYRGSIGVFAGATTSTYLIFNLLANPEVRAALDPLQLLVGNAVDSLATRVAYKLNLKGPSFSVQSACSTSLLAVHVACQSLLNGECDLALAGGVSINVGLLAGYRYEEGSILSPDGHCRAFDSRAQGTIFGSGAGVVALKRLAEAVADRDSIYATIRGSAVNNDGAAKVGYTAPSVEGQTAVIAEALAAAGVDPNTISYVEAHGTGTSLGDPVEIEALARAFRTRQPRQHRCAIGTVKSNIGHLDIASGVAGLIKTALALRHGALPASLHFERPNPRIDFAAAPFYVNTVFAEWKPDAAPRRAGVSSFGFGGTNVHMVLEETAAPEPAGASRPAQLLLLSARTAAALNQATARLAGHLEAHPDADLADVAFTLALGRRAFAHRRTLVGATAADAAAALRELDPTRVQTEMDTQDLRERSVAFLFPGQGAQYVGMGRGLYETEPAFREEVDHCAELLRRSLGLDLRSLLFPDAAGSQAGAQCAEQLGRTRFAQPALFVIEYALARLLAGWGIRPQAMIGHSLGEWVAACLSGVFSLEDALALVAARAQLMDSAPEGAMLAVPLPADEVRGLLVGPLELAAIDGPAECVAAGPHETIAGLERRLAAQAVPAHRLRTSHAFHSAAMDPVLEPFAHEIRQVRRGAPQIPYLSNLTGTWVTPEEATDAGYWARHLRQTVRFSDGLRELMKPSDRILLEVGPGQVLTSLARRHGGGGLAFSTMRRPEEGASDCTVLLGALGRLWLAGQRIDWSAFYGNERRRRLSLPTYPFGGERYWIEPRPAPAAKAATAQKQADIASWFHVPVFKPCPRPRPQPGPLGLWLVLLDERAFGQALTHRLRATGASVVTVRPGQAFEKQGEDAYLIDPRRGDDYSLLLADLAAAGRAPHHVLHLWSLSATEARPFAAVQETGYSSLLRLAQALSQAAASDAVAMRVVSDRAVAVGPGEPLEPDKAPLLGACKVIPQEVPGLACRYLDVCPQDAAALDRLLAEVVSDASEPCVALRGRRRWLPAFEPLPVPAAAESAFRQRGVYVVINGLEDQGFPLLQHLARSRHARLVLVEGPGSAAGEQNERRTRALEASGAEVLCVTGRPVDAAGVAEVLDRATSRFGEVHGLIYAVRLPLEDYLRPLPDANQEECRSRIERQARELAALREALAGRSLDFCLVLSSLSSVLGGPGTVVNTARGFLVDAHVAEAARSAETPWLGVDADAWRVQDEAADPLAPGISALAMEPEEGAEAIERLLAQGLVGTVVVSTMELSGRLRQEAARSGAHRPPPEAGPPAALHARPALKSPYAPPARERERSIVRIWQETLGLERVGVDDNFFELGGDSFIAIQVISRLRAELQADVAVASLYECLTVRSLADLLEREDGRDAHERTSEVQQLQERRARRKEFVDRQLAKRRDAAREGTLGEVGPGAPPDR